MLYQYVERQEKESMVLRDVLSIERAVFPLC